MQRRKPCLDCGRPTNGQSRCDHCFQTMRQKIEAARAGRPRNRDHYKGDYQTRARFIRSTAIACWICEEGWRPDDPWQADHIIAGDPTSPLAAAHRSCNITRSNQSRAKDRG